MAKNDVDVCPNFRVIVPIDKGFRFGPYQPKIWDREDIEKWIKSVSMANDLTEANLKIVREGEIIFFEATKNIDPFETLCLWPKFEDGRLLMDINFAPNKTTYECDVCHHRCNDKYSLISHKWNHTNDERPFPCSFCDQKYKWKPNLDRHIRQVHEEKYKCHFCKQPFENERALLYHEMTHSGKMPYNCEVCRAGYKSRHGLEHHLRTIHSIYKCFLCGGIWSSDELLKQHKKNCIEDMKNTKKRGYECDICHRRFRTKKCLVAHRSKHTNEKLFECSFCARTFRWELNLTTHIAKVHTEKYKCDLCEKVFGIRKELTDHLMTHLMEKPYQCEECGAEYETKVGLNYHKRVKHCNGTFECEICGKVWGSKDSLKKHKRCHNLPSNSNLGG